MSRGLLLTAIVIGTAVGIFSPRGQTSADHVAAAPATARALPPHAEQQQGSSDPITLKKQSNGHFFADVMINGQMMRCMIDTGATMVALPMEDARRAGISFTPATFHVIGQGASGPVTGENIVINRIGIGLKEVFDVRGAVISEGLNTCLLGQSFLSKISSIRIMDDKMVLG